MSAIPSWELQYNTLLRSSKFCLNGTCGVFHCQPIDGETDIWGGKAHRLVCVLTCMLTMPRFTSIPNKVRNEINHYTLCYTCSGVLPHTHNYSEDFVIFWPTFLWHRNQRFLSYPFIYRYRAITFPYSGTLHRNLIVHENYQMRPALNSEISLKTLCCSVLRVEDRIRTYILCGATRPPP